MTLTAPAQNEIQQGKTLFSTLIRSAEHREMSGELGSQSLLRAVNLSMVTEHKWREVVFHEANVPMKFIHLETVVFSLLATKSVLTWKPDPRDVV